MGARVTGLAWGTGVVGATGLKRGTAAGDATGTIVEGFLPTRWYWGTGVFCDSSSSSSSEDSGAW
jgi:hypothetical protein